MKIVYNSNIEILANYIGDNIMRIKWLDGLKGLACFAVLWHHFILGFLPGQYNGAMGRIGAIDPVRSPLSFIVNGNFMVALFMLASGI